MASWLNASGKNEVVLLRGPITEHLIGAYEIWAVYYLNGSMSPETSQRWGGKQGSQHSTSVIKLGSWETKQEEASCWSRGLGHSHAIQQFKRLKRLEKDADTQ